MRCFLNISGLRLVGRVGAAEVSTGEADADVDDAADETEAEDEAAEPGPSRRGTLSGGSAVSLALDIYQEV
jgi:hypothetical protein